MSLYEIQRPQAERDIALGEQLAIMQGRPIGPGEVARVLREAGVKYVIVGAHAANGYTGRPRATVDVDVIVQHPKKAARALAAAFPSLRLVDTPVGTRFVDDKLEAIDVMKPAGSLLWSRLLGESREVQLGSERIRVPSLEGMLAAKFASMVSPMRRLPDKQQDGVDFLRIVGANEAIDLAVTSELGDLVYSGGDKSC